MQRLTALAALLMIVALAATLPAATGAAPSAGASAKHRCKHKAKHHRKKKRCRKKKDAASGPAADQPKGEDPGAPSGPPGRLLATERELSTTQLQLQLSRASVAAGATIVEQYNAGSDPHNLILQRGDTVFAYPTLDPGGDQRQTLTLTHGTWTLYCSLLNHRELGMQATLTVN
jgi:plastocyanin